MDNIHNKGPDEIQYPKDVNNHPTEKAAPTVKASDSMSTLPKTLPSVEQYDNQLHTSTFTRPIKLPGADSRLRMVKTPDDNDKVISALALIQLAFLSGEFELPDS